MIDFIKQSRQAQCLEAMGIQRWVRRQLPVSTLDTFTTSDNFARSGLAVTVATPSPPVAVANLEPVVTSVVISIPPALPATSSLNWSTLSQQVAACTACELHRSRTQTVLGMGNQQAEWLFVGEAPGEEEDIQGLPFVGVVGQLLNAMLYAIGLRREDIYITNIVKCRPPTDHNPKSEEIARCQPFLQQQIALLKPKIIIALGQVAASQLLGTTTPIGQLRGKLFECQGIPLIATYHPAYLLRRPTEKRRSWQDLKFMLERFDNLSKVVNSSFGEI